MEKNNNKKPKNEKKEAKTYQRPTLIKYKQLKTIGTATDPGVTSG